MSAYSDQLKTAKRRDMEFFFGEDLHMTSGKYYFQFKRVLGKDEVIVLTNNLKMIKGNPVLVVGPSAGIYLKDFQVRKVSSYQAGINCYAVKLSRKYFKPYKFSFEFEDMMIENEETFDTFYEVAKLQEKENLAIREGWCN